MQHPGLHAAGSRSTMWGFASPWLKGLSRPGVNRSAGAALLQDV